MLKVPEDIEAEFINQSIRSVEACVIRYKAVEKVSSTPVLVTRPTFVLICSGTKQLKPQGSDNILTAQTGSVLVMRSGTHIMSEFRGEHSEYKSIILSAERTFLRETVGRSDVTDEGPRVVVSDPSSHGHQLFTDLPKIMEQKLPESDRQFKLRELLITLMSDKKVRQLILREVAEWGSTKKERLISIVANHCLSPLKVPDLARLCSMSLSSFKRSFQHIYGIAPGHWLLKTRLEHAHSMIRNSSYSIMEVSQESGYLDVSSFIRAFRRNFGITPGALRHDK
jgi:AraC family transcriptional regulator, exoenzyme S synthesis regulatory protein ExsA